MQNIKEIVIKIIMKIFGLIYANFNHVGYARIIGVNMGTNVHIYGNPVKMFGTEPWLVTLGNHVHITTDVMFITHDGGTLLFRHLTPDLEISAPIKVGDYVYFGVRSIILPGVKIGNNCIIAAGAVVTKDVPDNSVVGGIPAKILKSTQEYYEDILKSSIHLGHLKGEIKNRRLKEYFNYKSTKH